MSRETAGFSLGCFAVSLRAATGSGGRVGDGPGRVA